MIALQEHKLRSKQDIDEASAFLAAQGFASYWAAADTGPKGQPVGGVATIVAAKLGSKPAQVESPPGRLVACKVQAQLEAEIVFVSAYLHSGRGTKQPNLELLGNIAALQRQESRYVLAAGDWQNQPAAITRVGWTTRACTTLHAPKRATCIMRKSSSVIDYFVTSNELSTRCSQPEIQLNKHIATHRPVMMQLATSTAHVEPRLVVAEKIPAMPRSPVGPYNKPQSWASTNKIVDKAIQAAYRAAGDPKQDRQATRWAHRLHDQAYTAIVNNMEKELASKYDMHIQKPGVRARPANIQWVKSKPMQPKGGLRPEVGALPFRWLVEQGHRGFQHLLQTIAIHPKDIDGENINQYHEQLVDEVPEYVKHEHTANSIYMELVMLIAAIINDKANGSLVDTRPQALATMRTWEAKLQKATDRAGAHDRMAAHIGWRQWAIEAASNGAGKAHRWTKTPQPWRANVAAQAAPDHDAEPISIITELCAKFSKIWQPAQRPLPLPRKVLFPTWLPDIFADKVANPDDLKSKQDSNQHMENNDIGEIQTANLEWTLVRRKGTTKRSASQEANCSGETSGSPTAWVPDAEKDDEPLRKACRAVKSLQKYGSQTITGQNVAEASGSFRATTAQTYDGLHVRHWSSLEKEGQEIVAKLMCLSLALGVLPKPLRAVVAAAIPKATIGYRTIGLFPAYYRTMVRTLKDQFGNWEHEHPRRFYSFAAGKSAVLTVWAQTAQQEITSAIGKPSSATLLWDLSDFYEGMSRQKLLDREIKQDFPIAAAFLSITAYSGERIIQLNGMVITAGYPTKGVVAGCGIATYHVQAYHGPPIQAFMDARPHLALNIHIDDLCLSATGRCDDDVVAQISEGAAALETTIEQDLDSKVSIPKANLVATSDELRRRVGGILERLGHKSKSVAAVNLGIDMTGGIASRRVADRLLRTRRRKQQQRKPDCRDWQE